jgi:hypothetical protein
VFLIVLGFVFGFADKLCADNARRRGKSPLLISVADILFFLWGLIAWLVFCPEPMGPKSGGTFHVDYYHSQQ